MSRKPGQLHYTNVQDVTTMHPPCTLVVGNYQWWRVANVDGSTDWRMYLDCGGGRILLNRYNGLGWQKGISMGETFRFGGERTGMRTYMPQLEYKNYQNNWFGWSSPQCYRDNASNWEVWSVWSNNFEITQGSRNC